MALFALSFKTGVEKDLRKIPRELIPHILEKVESPVKEPFPRDCVKIIGSENFYRVRSGDYRIVYQVLQQEKDVAVHYMQHRRVVYRDF